MNSVMLVGQFGETIDTESVAAIFHDVHRLPPTFVAG